MCNRSWIPPGFPGRARPAPADVLRVSDDTGIPFVELREELARLGLCASSDPRVARLSEAERAEVSDFVDFLGWGTPPQGRSAPATSHQRTEPKLNSLPPTSAA